MSRSRTQLGTQEPQRGIFQPLGCKGFANSDIAGSSGKIYESLEPHGCSILFCIICFGFLKWESMIQFGLQLGKFEANNWFSPEDSPTFREDSGWKFLGDAMTLIADNRSWNLSKVRSGRRWQLKRGGTLTPWGVEWSWLEGVEDHVGVDLEIQDLWKPYLFGRLIERGLKIPNSLLSQ